MSVPQQPPKNLEKEYFKNKDNIQFTFDNIQISDPENLPLKIEAEEEILNFFHGNVLKPIDNPLVKRVLLLIFGIQKNTPQLYPTQNQENNLFLTTQKNNNDDENEEYNPFFKLKTRMEKQLVYSFYFILCIKFPQVIQGNMNQKNKVINYFKQKMQKYYAKTFTEIPSPKDDVVNYSIFILGYIVHYLFYKYFIKHREIFDLRFDYDCYHILIFEFNGIYVSDHYVRLQIEQIFTNKFLEYERIRQLYIQKQAKLAMQKPNSFFGLKLNTISQDNLCDDGKIFQKTIVEKFINNPNKNALKKILSEEEDKPRQNKSAINFMSVNDNNNKSQNSQKDSNNNNSQQQSHLDSQQSQSQQNLQTKWDLSNFQLNCYQISPAMNKVLSYEDMSLPLVKKKMVQHSMEKAQYRQNNMLSQLKQLNRKKHTKKIEENVDVQKPSNLELYGIQKQVDYQKYPLVAQKFIKPIQEQNIIFSVHQQGYSQLPSSLEILKRQKVLENPSKKVKQREIEKMENLSMLKNIYEAKRIVLDSMEQDYQKKLVQSKYHVIPKNQMHNPQDNYQSLKDVIQQKKKEIEKQKEDMNYFMESNQELYEYDKKAKQGKGHQFRRGSKMQKDQVIQQKFQQAQFMQRSNESHHSDNVKKMQNIASIKQTLIQKNKHQQQLKIQKNQHRIIVTEIYDKDGVSITQKEQQQKILEYEKLRQKQGEDNKKIIYKDSRKDYKKEQLKILDPVNYNPKLIEQSQTSKRQLNASSFIQDKVENALKKNAFQDTDIQQQSPNSGQQIQNNNNFNNTNRQKFQDNFKDIPQQMSLNTTQTHIDSNRIKHQSSILSQQKSLKFQQESQNLSVQQKRMQNSQHFINQKLKQQKSQELFQQGQLYHKQISEMENFYSEQYQNQRSIVQQLGNNSRSNSQYISNYEGENRPSAQIEIKQSTLDIIHENYKQQSQNLL